MIKNYLKVAWRNLRRNSLYSVINIGGLAIGMAVSFMLFIYAYNEFSFDKFNVNNARLYHVLRNQPSNGEIFTNSATPIPLAPAMIRDFPEFVKVARANWTYPILVNYKNKALKVNTMSADPAILDMFTFYFIHGDKKMALADPSSIVLTESAAKAIFGDADPMGQVIKLDNQHLMKVSAVIKDNPQNSSFSFNALMSWQAFEAQNSGIKTSGWGSYNFQTYAMLKPNASLPAVNAKLKTIVAKYDPDNKENTMFLYPFAQEHLYGQFKNGKNIGGAIESVRLFLYLAIGILLIACINFMNLSTARSERRAREVGIRKAVGSNRMALIAQFIGESVLLAFFSFLVAVGLVWLLSGTFSALININLHVPYDNVFAWIYALGVTLITGIVAGSYPALFLSSFKPVKVLKGQITSVKSIATPRKILVVAQFTFAVALILVSIFIYKQINYIKDRPVGYDQRGLVEMPYDGAMDKKFDSF
ncbi:MAG TPA: ABC transporter permease, partial [Mucilaginibacter sp.]|nr:ABC transporter permease [Mucilaginibacter sp.]